MEPNVLISLIGDLGAMGFILYLANRLTTHTIPRLANEFEQATDKQRQDFKEALSQQRTDFITMVNREQDYRERDIQKLYEAMKELTVEIRKRPLNKRRDDDI